MPNILNQLSDNTSNWNSLLDLLVPDYYDYYDVPSSRKFDPEGDAYDYETAIRCGIRPDKTGHWPSRCPKTGQLLKGRGHPTFWKTLETEEAGGYEIYKGKSGKYYSRPKRKK